MENPAAIRNPEPWLETVDHITFPVRAKNIKKWAWLLTEVLGGKLTMRVDDVDPEGKSSMMLWEVDFGKFAFALVAGLSREERSHVDVWVDANGEFAVQHIALRPPNENFEGLLAHLGQYGLKLQGEPLARSEGGMLVKQAFTRPVHTERNPATVYYFELQARPGSDSPITFSVKTGKELYRQAQAMMTENIQAEMIDWSLMPEDWEPPGV